MGHRRVDVVSQAHRDAQHRAYLCRAERRPDAVPGCIADEDHQPPIVERNQVEGVATGLVRRHADACQLVARDRGHLAGQKADLNLPGDRELPLHSLLGDQRLGHPRPLQCDGALGGERLGDSLVPLVERALVLVEQLQRTDECLVVPDQRHRQRTARAIAGLAVDFRIEARICIAVGHIDDRARLDALADDSALGRDPDRVQSGPDLDDQLVAVGVVQKDRSPIGGEHVAGGIDHLTEHRR